MGMLALFLLGLLGVGMALGGEKPDPKMSPQVAATYNALMADPNANPLVLENAAAGFEAGGFKNAAMALRARAAQLRALQQNQPGFGGGGLGGGGGGGFGPVPGFPGAFPGASPGIPGTPPPGMPPGFPGSLPGAPPPGMPPGVVPLPPSPGGFGGDPPMPPDVKALFDALMADPNGDPLKLEMAAMAMQGFFPAAAAALRARAALLRGTPGGVAPPPPVASPSVYVIKSGDSASAIAKKFTGDGTRWKELLVSNPNLKASTENVNGTMTTLVKPFNPGQVLVLPVGWPSKPL